MGELLDARTAAGLLGIDVRSLYAYVSRGSLRRLAGPDGRKSLYDADDVAVLARRSRPRTVARPAVSVDVEIFTRVSTISAGVVRYRGVDLLELVAGGTSFERVAQLLWPAEPGLWDVDGPPTGLIGDAPAAHRHAAAVIGAEIPDALDWPAAGRACIAAQVRAYPLLSAPPPGVSGALWSRLSPLAPTPARVGALDLALVLLAEHELATSTLAVRVTASVRARPVSCVLAGLAALDGDLHGGTYLQVHQRLASAARNKPVTWDDAPGFGHSVHREGDPRTAPLLQAVTRIATPRDRRLIEQARHSGPAQPNADFALAALTYVARMPPGAGTAIFAIARTAGWIAHAAEEYGERPLRFRGRSLGPGAPAAGVGHAK